MSPHREVAIKFAQDHMDEFLSSLKKLVEIPSISTLPENQSDVQRAASELAYQMEMAGMQNVKVIPTQGHPVVYGEDLSAGPDKPVVLVYGHYDVQPVDPLELWETPPFEPQVKGNYLVGRGASDMKGQILATLSAYHAIRKTQEIPVNVKFVIEGEEEIGSPHFRTFVEKHRDLLRSDISLNPDAGMMAPNLPTIVYALRGLAFFELLVYGPSHDLHSGVFGGIIHNPAQVLCELIAGLHDKNGTVTLPGFYDRVKSLPDWEKQELSRLPLDAEVLLEQTGAPDLWGEPEFNFAQRIGARPTLEVNGLYSGFIGQGSKTIIPAYAMAKISCRLVPDQNPQEVHQQFLQHLKNVMPSTVRWELKYLGGGNPCMTDIRHPANQALASALEKVWGIRPVYKREGGSVPVVGDFKEILGIESILTGFGLPDDRIHSPNEHLHLPTWKKGIEALIHFFFNLAEQEGLEH